MIDVSTSGNVYILTREGKEYSDEGCHYVEELIKKSVNDDRKFVFSMGGIYNDPDHLRTCLVNNRKSYVIISTHQKIWPIGLENNQQKMLIDELRNPDNKGKTSWEIALNLFYRIYPNIEKDFPRSEQ